jgi:ribosomal subunit interface protein
MRSPVHITFHGLDVSPAVEDYVQRRAAKLDTFYGRITSCRVTLEAPHHRRKHGSCFRVRVEVSTPGADLVVGHGTEDAEHRDLYAAIDDAFDRAVRMLQDHAQRRRGETKVHEHERS